VTLAARVLHRIRNERGYTLIEMLVVIVILSLVLGGLTTVFVRGSAAELDLNRKFTAQQQARLALTRFRVDAHCATTAQAKTIGTYPGVKLDVSHCYNAATTVSWCAVQVTTTPPRYQLWRSTATANICTSTDTSRVMVADYLTTTTGIFTTPNIPLYGLQTIGVSFNVSSNAASTTKDVYVLTDAVVARNSARCTGTTTTPADPRWDTVTSTCIPVAVP
jgi:prepilin-type N-terminal cleavage/methylation domain-containing protein